MNGDLQALVPRQSSSSLADWLESCKDLQQTHAARTVCSQFFSKSILRLFEEEEGAHVPKCNAAWWSKVLVFNIMWVVSSTTVVIMLKQTVSDVGDVPALFPFPFTFTSIQEPLAGLLTWLLSYFVWDIREESPPVLTWAQTAQWMSMAAMQGLELGVGNKAMQYINVADSTMLRAASIFFVMVSAFMWGLEGLGFLRVVSAVLLVAGGAAQGFGQCHESSEVSAESYLIGSAMILSTMLLAAQRWVLTQWILRGEREKGSALGRLSKLQLLTRVLPATSFVTLPMAAVFETEAFWSDEVWRMDLYVRASLIALGIAMLQFSELNLVHRLSAVGFQVDSAVHQIPIALAGVFISHNVVSPNAAFGFALCLGGSMVYIAARFKESKESTSKLQGVREQLLGC